MFKNLKFSKNYLYLFFIISALCFFFKVYKDEADIYFLLSHGRYVLENGIPYTDILSMHTEFNFVMQQWLSSVIFYLIHNYLGSIGLYIFIFIMNCIITFLIYKLCLIVSQNKKFSSCFVSVIAMVLLQIGFIVPRPQIFTFIVLIMILMMLELFSSKRKKYLYFMPLLSICLINLHASMWPMIFIFCMPYVVELILKKDKDVLKLIAIMIFSIIVGIINPYGFDAMTYSIKSYGYKYICDIVGEMKAFNLLGQPYVFYFSVCIIVTFLFSNLIILLNSKKDNFRISHLLLFYGTFYMSLTSIRNFSLFIIGTIPFLVKYFDFQDDDKLYLNKGWIINFIILFIIFLGLFIFVVQTKRHEFKHFSSDAALYLKDNESKDIKLYTEYSDGALFEYYGFKPYIDARAEVFIDKINGKEDILEEYIKFNLDVEFREEFINKYDFDYYVIDKKNKNLVDYLINYKDNKLELIYATSKNYLIKKVS